MSCTQRGLDKKIEQVIIELVKECNYASGVRIHNLAYLAEIERIDEIIQDPERDRKSWEQLIDVDFKCYFDGAYSEELQMEIESLCMDDCLVDKNRIINEREYTIYSTDISETGLCSDDISHIKTVCDKYDHLGIEELVDRVKRGWLFDNTEFGQVLNFSDYINRFDSV